MSALDRRSAGVFASVFYIVSCVLFSVDFITRICALIIGPLLALAVWAVSRKGGIRRSVCAVVFGILISSVFSWVTVDIVIPKMSEFDENEICITGTVTQVRYRSSYGGIYTVDSDAGTLTLNCENGELSLGDIITCTVQFGHMDDEYVRYSRPEGVFLCAEAVDEVSVSGYDGSLKTASARLRAGLSAKLQSEMSEKTGGFAASLLLGDKSVLDDSVSRDFRTLGISHVLALSGTHLTLLFYGLSRLIPDKRRVMKPFVICTLVILYMALTGFSASVTRAGIMFIMAVLGMSIGRKTDSFTSLSVSVFLICLFCPWAPFDVGLQLSYLSVVGLIIGSELVNKLPVDRETFFGRMLVKLIPAFTVPSVILPLMWLYFGSVSLVSPIANLILVPIASAFIPVSAVLLILSWVPGLFVPLSSVTDVLINGFLRIAEYVAEFCGPSFSLTGTATAIFVLLFVLSVIAAVIFFGRLRRVFVSASCVLMCLIFAASQFYVNRMNGGISVYFASNKNDEALCVVTEGYNILIDMCMYPSAVESAASLGSVYGSDSIDALFITKPYGSHRRILAEIGNNYYLESIWLPCTDNEKDSADAAALASEAENMGIEVYTYFPGETLSFGNCEFVAPTPAGGTRAVDFSLKYNGKTVLYSGCPNDGSADVNIVGNAGSKNRVLPELAGVTVISPESVSKIDAGLNGALIAERAVIRIFPGSEPTAEIQ